MRIRTLGDKALDAHLGTRPGCALQSTAAWGMISFPGPLLARRPGYIHGSTRLQRLDLHVDLRIHIILCFSAEWHSLLGILSRNDDSIMKGHRHCSLFTGAGHGDYVKVGRR